MSPSMPLSQNAATSGSGFFGALVGGAVVTGVAALIGPVLGVPALAAAAFVGTYMAVVTVATPIFTALINALPVNEGIRTVLRLCSLVPIIGGGLAAAVGVTTAAGLSVSLGMGALTLLASGAIVIGAALALGLLAAGVILAVVGAGLLVAYSIKRCQEA